MNHSISLPIPCLGTSKAIYNHPISDARPRLLDTKTKVILAVSAILAVVGAVLLFLLPPVGAACMFAAGLGLLSVAVFKMIDYIRLGTVLNSSSLERIEKLEPAKQLAAGIEVSPTLKKELEEIIPAIDAPREDPRVAFVHYDQNKIATFTLKSAPDLQFRISVAAPRSSVGCAEARLEQRYENAVYAKEICLRENYSSLSVPPMKPLYLKVNGSPRSLLVEKEVQREARVPAKDLELAIRQMVQFLLQTGGDSSHEPVPFVPITGGKLALQNLHHLTENPVADAEIRECNEIRFILDETNSLLASLDREDLIDIALDELKIRRPTSLSVEKTPEDQTLVMTDLIQDAKEKRLRQIHNPIQI